MIESLTPEQEAMLPVLRDKWIAIGLSCEPANQPEAELGIKMAYEAAKLSPIPERFIWLDSPLAGCYAAAAIVAVQELVASKRQPSRSAGGEKPPQLPPAEQAAMVDQVIDALTADLSEWLISEGRDPRKTVAEVVHNLTADQVRPQTYRAVCGQHETWLSFYDTFDQFGLEEAKPIRGLVKAAQNAGWWWPFDNVVIMTDRAAELHRDAQGGLHHETGPAMRYRDGFAIYSWHGQRVPADLITEGWSTERILKEENTEIRRCAIERMGWDQFIDGAGLQQVGTACDDPGNPGQTLALYDIPEQIYDSPMRVLLCTNGTVERTGERRRFGLTVPQSCRTPLEAAAWTYGLTADVYATAQRRT